MSQLDPRVIELIRVYQQARKNLLAIIFKSETSGSIASYQRALLRQVEEELSNLDITCRKWTQETLEGFYMEGVDNADTYLKEHDLPITGSFAKLHTEAINSIVENTLYDLSIANKHVGRKIRDDIRDICLDVIGQKIATGKSVEQAKNMLMDRLLSDGIAYIKDGQKQMQLTKTWQLDKYAEMVARSTTREATNRGTLNQLEALGYDLVQVSNHNSPCPLCAQYEGKVYSISGDDKRFPPLDDMFDGEFCNIHPNCQHVVTPYIEEFAKDVNDDILKSNTEMTEQELKNKTAGYYEQQKENRQINKDKMQYEKYKLVLGKKDVGSFEEFRETKQDEELYSSLKSQYRKEKANLRK